MNPVVLAKGMVKDAQACLYLIQKHNPQSSPELLKLIENCDICGLRAFFRTGYDDWAMAELRAEATKLGVRYVFHRTKQELIQDILEIQSAGQAV